MTGPHLDAILMRRRRGVRDDLVPLLFEVHGHRGWLQPEDVEQIADHVGVSSEIAWNAARGAGCLRFEPPGRWHLRVCCGTNCVVRGAEATLARLSTALGIGAGQTTADGSFSLDTTLCLGECAFAPILTVNGELHRAVVADAVSSLLDDLRRLRIAASRRGAEER